MWDFEKGGEKRRFEGHTDVVVGVVFSPDGSRAVSSSVGDKNVRLWDVKSGKDLQHRGELGGYSDNTFAFTPNSRRIVLGNQGDIYLIDARTLADVRSIKMPARGRAFAPDSIRAMGWYDCVNLYEWDLETGQDVRYSYGHSAAVSSVAFTPDGHYLLSGSQDATVNLWDLEVKRVVGSYAHGAPIHSVTVSPDGRYAFFAGAEAFSSKSLGLWEVKRRQLAVSFAADPGGAAYSVAFSPDGRLALSGGYNREDQLLDVEELVESRTFKGVNSYSVAFSPDGKQAVTGGVAKSVRLWDVTTGKETRSLTGHTDTIKSVAFAPDGRHILSSGDDTTVRLWDLQEDQPKPRLLEGGPKAAITCVTIAPDGKTFAASGKDGQIVVWKGATGERQWHTQLPGAVNGVAYAPDSRHLATANANGTIFILRLPE